MPLFPEMFWGIISHNNTNLFLFSASIKPCSFCQLKWFFFHAYSDYTEIDFMEVWMMCTKKKEKMSSERKFCKLDLGVLRG